MLIDLVIRWLHSSLIEMSDNWTKGHPLHLCQKPGTIIYSMFIANNLLTNNLPHLISFLWVNW